MQKTLQNCSCVLVLAVNSSLELIQLPRAVCSSSSREQSLKHLFMFMLSAAAGGGVQPTSHFWAYVRLFFVSVCIVSTSFRVYESRAMYHVW